MARQNDRLQFVEEMLIEAWLLLLRMPDRERGWLRSGTRSAWPEHLRDWWEYADSEAQPRSVLSRREMRLVDRVFLASGCLTEQLGADARKLLGLVVAMRARPDAGGFRWEAVWLRIGGKRSGVTKDAIARRYERALARLSVLVEDAQEAGGPRLQSLDVGALTAN